MPRNTLSRRAALAGLAAVVPAGTAAAMPTAPDPAIAVVARHESLLAEAYRLYTQADEARLAARKVDGDPPFALKADNAWEERVGVAALRREADESQQTADAALDALSKTRPTTPAGAAAMIDHLRALLEEDACGEELQRKILATVAEALSGMKA